MRKIATFTTLLIAMTGCASVDKQIDDWELLTKEHFSQTTYLKDGDLETEATFHTRNGHQFKNGLMGVVWDDHFFRAFVDKKTGKVTFQLYQILRYRDSGWRHYNRFNYKTPAGVQTEIAQVISRDVDCSGAGSTYSNCKYEEHVSIMLSEDVMRWFAGTYNPAKALEVGMAFKVASQSGVDHDDVMSAAEAAGLVDRVDAYLAANGFTKK